MSMFRKPMLGMGATNADGGKDADANLSRPSTSGVLNQDLVPWTPKAIYLRKVKTVAQAVNYAACGFHVSVARGQSGGCKDRSHDFSGGGTRQGTCAQPLHDPVFGEMWAQAAAAYLAAYRQAAGGVFLPAIDAIIQANILADAAYKAEGVEPPRDPENPTPGLPSSAEPAMSYKGGAGDLDSRVKLGIGLAVGLGLWYLMANSEDDGTVSRDLGRGFVPRQQARRYVP